MSGSEGRREEEEEGEGKGKGGRIEGEEPAERVQDGEGRRLRNREGSREGEGYHSSIANEVQARSVTQKEKRNVGMLVF